ncbi:MAG TPA: hypothetical protein VGH13_23050 [Xanthobacteraceae bacterium]
MSMTSVIPGETSVAQTAAGSAAEQAVAKLAERQKNSDWTAKVLSGSGPEVKEFHELMAAKSGGDKISAIIDGSAEVSSFEVTTGGELSTYNQMQSAEWLREMGIDDKSIRQILTGAEVSKQEFDAAKTRRSDRMQDAEFVKRWLSGNREAAREMTLLNIIIASGVKAK